MHFILFAFNFARTSFLLKETFHVSFSKIGLFYHILITHTIALLYRYGVTLIMLTGNHLKLID